MYHRLPSAGSAVPILLIAVIIAVATGACSAAEPLPASPPAGVHWEWLGEESDGNDLVVSVRIFWPVELTVILDRERTPDATHMPDNVGIATFRFAKVPPGEHSVRITDAVGNSISRGVAAGPPPMVKPGEGFALGVAEKAQVGAGGPVVTFVGVTEDSRCATDAVCVRAGEAVVALKVEPPSGVETQARVTVPREGGGTSIAAGYSITVLDLTPLPSSTRSIDPGQYRATLRVDAE